MTLPEERIAADETVNEILTIIKELILDKVEKVDDDDGGYFWIKKDYIHPRVIDECEVYLNQCARIYRTFGVKNTNKKYRKYSQLVAHVRLDFLPKSLKEVLEELETHEANDAKEDILPIAT